MSFLGFGKKKARVTVHGYSSSESGVDGRYRRQASENEKALKKKIAALPLIARTPDELCAYIEEKYHIEPLPKTDELYDEISERLSFLRPQDLVIYNMRVLQGSEPAAWLEIYIEKNHAFLSYEITELECKDRYSVNRVVADIVTYFGASKEDKKKKTDRYAQFTAAQKI